ncbi:uncharacterized protein H6S33_001707 [Morchella sextelata]|uniref:uncharacterized protein n=1 Tax=Morchella sextelata TaxID=1174677 RepID=UPI001D05C137|nr:uncharacterized protein H6S33_001707 [Morchella sextelata]KAH0608573.1 hypothetical protein H6S33_001707 [Morchella sextelata]
MSSHTSSSSDSTAGLGLPQVAACLLVGYFVFRWFFKTTDPSSSAAQRPSPVDSRRLQQQVDVIRGMFPQIPAGAVQAELIRNGGSIEITTEKILTNGFLPEPPAPVTLAPVPPPAPAPAARPSVPTQRRVAPPAASSASGSNTILSQYSDLITRYNLHSRLQEGDPSSAAGPGGKGKAPATKSDRQLAHHSKRDDMILAARRRIQEMDRVAAGQS